MAHRHFFFLVFCVGLVLGLHIISSESYASYSSDSFTESDVEAILTYFNITHDSATVAGYQSQINQVRSANNLSKMNIIFCLMDQVLYMVPSNGTVGNTESHLALFSISGIVYLRQHDHFNYSGDEIISASYTLIPTSYMITRYGNQTKTNWQYNWNYNQNIIAGANSQYVNFPYVLATFPTHTVASWVNYGQYDWRFLYNYIELNGWTPPVLPTPIPTEIPTLTPGQGEGTVDLSTTNEKIDNVNESVQEVNQSINNLTEQISGDNQEIINSLTEVPSSGDFSISSGDIIAITSDYDIVDPHESIWGHLIDGLDDALTSTTEPNFSFEFLGKTFNIPVLNPNYPTPLKNFFSTMMTVVSVLVFLKFYRKIIHIFQSGGALEVAHMFSGFDWSDFF